MKKTGAIVGASFLAGALFFALSFGFLQRSEKNEPIISPAIARAETLAPLNSVIGGNFVPVVKRVKPAVVQVISRSFVETQSPFDFGPGDDLFNRFFNAPRRSQKRPVTGLGSGFFISADGYILTNNHVVQDAVKVTIMTTEQKEFTAKIIGTDPKADLALLKIGGKNLPFLELGDSNKVEVGEWVLAIGNPFGLNFTVTSGIISAEGRQLNMAEIEDFLQTDASINQGNSGGPLVNMRGEAIGINSTILAPSGGNIGIGFAIPSNMAKKVVNDLKTKGKVVRGWLGITMTFLSESLAKEYDQPTTGALVTQVADNSPAAKAGLKRNDLITEVNGKKITSTVDLQQVIANANPGDMVELTLFRNNSKQSIKLKIGEAPQSSKMSPTGDESAGVELGMTVEKNNPSFARENELKTSSGIVVTNVDRGGVAYESGLRAGDVILQVNRTEINSIDQFRKIMAAKESGTSVLLYINRNGDETAVRFTVPER